MSYADRKEPPPTPPSSPTTPPPLMLGRSMTVNAHLDAPSHTITVALLNWTRELYRALYRHRMINHDTCHEIMLQLDTITRQPIGELEYALNLLATLYQKYIVPLYLLPSCKPFFSHRRDHDDPPNGPVLLVM